GAGLPVLVPAVGDVGGLLPGAGRLGRDAVAGARLPGHGWSDAVGAAGAAQAGWRGAASALPDGGRGAAAGPAAFRMGDCDAVRGCRLVAARTVRAGRRGAGACAGDAC